MNKLIYNVNGLETRSFNKRSKHSMAAQTCHDQLNPTLQKFKAKPITERPTIIIDNGSYQCRAGWSF